MRKTLILIGVLFFVALPLFGQWHSDFRVTNNTGSSYTPYTGTRGIEADAEDVYITWYDYSSSPYYVRYHSFPIGTPSQTPNGEQVSTTYGYTPVVSTYNGSAFVTWYNSDVLYTRIKSGTWGSIESHGIGGGCTMATYPGTCFDDDGNLHVAFNRYSSTSGDMRGRSVWYQRRNSGGGWTTPVLVYDPHWEGGSASSYYYSYYPSICITSDGVIHMSFGNSNGYRLYHAWSTNNGATWYYETLTGTNSCYYSYATSICNDSEDNLYIAYVSYPSPYHINVISGTTDDWGSPVQVDASTYAYVYYPSACCDTFDNIWVCWDDRSGQSYEIYYNRMDGQTGSWDGPQALTANDGQYSRRGQIAADDNGNVHICWYDNRDGNYEIYYNWYSSSSGPGPGGERDLACTRILQPVGGISKESIEPQAVIANLGENVDSGYAKCYISGPGTNYNKGNLEGIVYLDPGQEKQISFPEWEPTGAPGDKYRIEVVVYLWPEKTIADFDSTNNTKLEYATIASATQVVATTITMPEEGATIDRMKPSAYFTNVGSEPAVNFYCHCDITPGTTTLAYFDSVGVSDTLQPGDSTFIEFAEWTSLDETPFTADFYVSGVDGAMRSVIFNGIPWTGIGEKPYLYCSNLSVSGAGITFTVPKTTTASLKVYDATGKLVSTLHQGSAAMGTHSFNLNARSGVYFVKLVTPDYTAVRKVVIF